MKKLLFILVAGLILILGTLSMNAATSVSSAKIYINPGHGSWGPNDRPMATIPYPMLSSTGRPDTCGFYESNTNLWKGLRLREALIDLGVQASNIKMSRVKNGPYPYVSGASNEFIYNRKLSEICEEVDTWGADMFFSIHSDAATEGGTANRSLYLFRGKDSNNYVAGSKAMAQALWPLAYVGANGIDYASSTSTNIRGDIDFYGSSSTRYGTKGNYTGYLGVLKHGIPGFLAEGYCHTYQPARHRALNKDYCGQEGVRYSRGIASYFGWATDTKGYIMGFVKDKSKSVSNSLYNYKSGTRAGDEYWPVMGAHVYLYKDGTKVATYTTDKNYNGVFVFDRLTPGTYSIVVTASGYEDYTQTVTVTANNTTYPGIYLTAGEGTDPGDDPETPDPTTEKIKGIYAYNLNLVKGEDNQFTFSFNANSDAASGRIIFTDSITGATVGDYTLSSVKEGANTFTISNADLPEAAGEDQVLNWSVELTGTPITAIARLDNADSNFSYTRACPVSDNNPESDWFGRFYVSAYTASSSEANGLYAYNADWSRINGSPYKGGLTFRNNMRPAIDAKGTIYFTDWGDAHSGIYLTYPADNFSTFTQFFQGTRESSGLWTNNGVNVGSSIISASIAGEGADTRLYAFLEDFNQRDVAVYNIGNSDGTLATTWGTSPSAIIKTSNLNGGKIYQDNSAVYADSRGGLWVCTYRSQGNNNSTAPSLIYVNAAGSIVYDSGSLSDLDGSLQAAFAVNRAETRLAVNDASGNVRLYDISWNNNVPTLTATGKTFRADVLNSSNQLQSMAFDYADNLIVGGAGIAIYSTPQDNVRVTPAKVALSLVKGEVVVPEPEPYVIKKDIDTYADTDNVSFVSNWVRSVKSDYDNITFEEDGIKNRGFNVSGDKVYVTGRSENSSSADLFLSVLDRATGETLSTLQLGSEAQVELYGCNDILLDAAGHLVISNLTTDVSTVPLQLFQVDTISGAVTRVASLLKTNAGTARVDHCAVNGDVASGNFTVTAAQANGKNIITWWIENGEVTKSHVIEAQAFYPATATGFGIAPRTYSVDSTHVVITGSSVHPTLYDITTGAVDDSFANNTAIQPDGLYANGYAAFTLGDRRFIVYPNDGFNSTTGNRWTIAVNEQGNSDLADFATLYRFPTQGLGAVNSQTWGAPVVANVADDGRSAEIVVYVPGEGLASYTLTDLSPVPDPQYIVKKDIDTYADTLDLQLESNWVRSVKSEYDNITFEDNGIRNRGFAVSGDKVFIAGRSANSTDADIYLDVLDRATGETLSRLTLGSDAKVAYFPVNDVLSDDNGNIVVSNLSLNLSTTPLKLFSVDTVGGDVTLVATLESDIEARIDHCNISGDVTSGNFVVMAAQANGNRLFTWTVADGTATATSVEAQAFDPATATGFGIAPRVNVVDATHAWVSGQTTYPTLYDMTTGQIVDSFADNEDIRPAGINANGAATPFTLDGRHLLLYPSEDYRSTLGNKWSLAVSSESAAVADLGRAFEFPTRGIGAVHSQTWGAPALVLPTGDKTADIFVYAPGAGLASYTLTSTYVAPQPVLEGDVNLDGSVNAGDVSAVYNVMLGVETDEGIMQRADVNSDGSVNAGDVSAIYTLMLQ